MNIEEIKAANPEALEVLKEMEDFLRDFRDPKDAPDGKVYLTADQGFRLFEGFAKMAVLLSKSAGLNPREFVEGMLMLYMSCPQMAMERIATKEEGV